MKRTIKKAIIFLFLLLILAVIEPKDVQAYIDKYTTNISLDRSTDDFTIDFTMPKDGTIKLNITVADEDIVPGSLTFAIQTGYSKSSTKLKEITGITSSQGITDMEVDLQKGEYYLFYQLNNESGDLSDTSLGVKCEIQILPTIPVNITELTAHSIKTLDEITDDGYDTIKFGDKYADLVLPFTANQSGGLIMSMAGSSYYSNSLTAEIYQDKECTKPIGEVFTLESFDGPITCVESLPEKGTYYVKFTLDISNATEITEFKIKLYTISAGARTLTDTTVAYQSSGDSKILYKITATDTGLLTFVLTPYYNSNGYKATVQLLDKNKKKIKKFDTIASVMNSVGSLDPMLQFYTVSKGTYYIQVDTSCGVYELEYFLTKCVNQAGSSKTKATTLKIDGKSAEGYFTISDKTTTVDWFKFTVSSKQYVKLTVAYKLDGYMRYEIIDSKGNVLYNSDEELECTEGYYLLSAGNTFLKGTYYIKIYKEGDTSSFSYALAIKKK